MLKKKIFKAMSIALALSMFVCSTGCSGNAEVAKTGPKNASAPPNYADTAQIVDMYAYIGPTDGSYYNASGQIKHGEDHRTKERYQEYKDCGMSILLLLGNNAFMGSSETTFTVEAEKESFAQSRVKTDLDLCEEVGLKTIVFDNRIWRLSTCEMPLIKEGDIAKPLWFVSQRNFYNATTVEFDENSKKIKFSDGKEQSVDFIQYQFDSMDALKDYVEVLMCSYKDHPAFYGVTLFDEPAMEKLKAVGQLTQAIKGLYPECYVHTCLLPYYGGNHSLSVFNTLRRS